MSDEPTNVDTKSDSNETWDSCCTPNSNSDAGNSKVRRSRAFCITWNNYPTTWRSTFDSIPLRYWIMGKEVAPTTGTPHLQGYLYYENARSIRSVRKSLPGCHVLVARGTAEQNKTYCSKSGDFYESGICPRTDVERGDGERRRWDLALAAARNGDLEAIPSDIYVRCVLSN